MENGGVIGDVGHAPLVAAVKPTSALLIWVLAEQNAESSAGRDGGIEEVLKVTKRGSFVPHNLAQIRPR